MTFPQTWSHSSHTHEGITHPTYRKGTGPGVIVIHEIPGITPAVSSFAQEVVSAGYTVVMPSLFGVDGAAMTPLSLTKAFRQVCSDPWRATSTPTSAARAWVHWACA